MPPPIDPQLFRSAMAQFATGITIISAQRADGSHAGITVNSFNSVSLNPPLVLWSLSKSSSNRDTFQQATHCGISVLAANQEALAVHFSTFKGDRFAALPSLIGQEALPGLGGCLLIPGALAHFECRMKSRYEEGDHDLMVAEVLRCAVQEGPALVYRARRYVQA